MTSWSRLFVYDDLGTTDSAGETTLVNIRPQTLYAFALKDAFDNISLFTAPVCCTFHYKMRRMYFAAQSRLIAPPSSEKHGSSLDHLIKKKMNIKVTYHSFLINNKRLKI